jgi:hypothetical protein
VQRVGLVLALPDQRRLTALGLTPDPLQQLASALLAERVGRRANGQSYLLWWLTLAGAKAVELTGIVPPGPTE